MDEQGTEVQVSGDRYDFVASLWDAAYRKHAPRFPDQPHMAAGCADHEVFSFCPKVKSFLRRRQEGEWPSVDDRWEFVRVIRVETEHVTLQGKKAFSIERKLFELKQEAQGPAANDSPFSLN